MDAPVIWVVVYFMAMNKKDMAKAIVDGFNEPEKPADAMNQFSAALKSYLEDNIEVEYSWSAQFVAPPAPPVIDPATSYTASVKFPVFSIMNPLDMSLFGPMIMTAVVGGLILPDDPTFIVPPGVFLPIPFILTQSKVDNQKDSMEHMCNEIINGIKMMINPTPLPGIHLTFVVPTPGAIMTSIK